jgi:hypothetical protein
LNKPVTLGAAPEMPGAIFGKSTDIETKWLNVKSQTSAATGGAGLYNL